MPTKIPDPAPLAIDAADAEHVRKILLGDVRLQGESLMQDANGLGDQWSNEVRQGDFANHLSQLDETSTALRVAASADGDYELPVSHELGAWISERMVVGLAGDLERAAENQGNAEVRQLMARIDRWNSEAEAREVQRRADRDGRKAAA